MEWLKDSFFEEMALKEEYYAVAPVDEEVEMEEKAAEEEEDDEAFVDPTYTSHARGSWIVREEKEFALFLASDPQKNEEGLSIFLQYQRV